MCGRYTLSKNLAEIAAYFRAIDINDGQWLWEANFNIAPAAVVPVIALNGQGVRAVVPMRWGLHPHWSKNMPQGRPLFNARLETAFEKPSFRTPWRRRRALIPYSGWYEWDRLEGVKQPYYITPDKAEQESDISALAGLWDQYHVDEGIMLLSMTILTTPALGDIKHIHHRMPVRLPQEQWQAWLEPDSRPQRVMEHKLGGQGLSSFMVDSAVNSGRAIGAGLRAPL